MTTNPNQDCAYPGDHEHDHRMCQDAVAGGYLTPAETARALADLLDRSGSLRLEIIRGPRGRHGGYCVTAGHDGLPPASFYIRDVLGAEQDAEQARLIHEVYEELDRDGTLALFREAYSADPAGDGCDPEAHR